MKQLNRTAPPPVLEALAAKELALARAHFLGTSNGEGFDFAAYRHKDVKNALAELSGGNCAYCEANYDATEPVDLEHFRPKGGYETATGLRKPGYWWLAASWDNLLPSCIRCNRRESQEMFDGSWLVTGKGNHFPLADPSLRATNVGDEIYEEPLLLNPCRDDPANFIKFVDMDGAYIAVPVDQDPTSLTAKRARASIDLYGLNRAGLVRDRSTQIRRAKMALALYDEVARILDNLAPDRYGELQGYEQIMSMHIETLKEFANGKGAYSGMLVALIRPTLTDLRI